MEVCFTFHITEIIIRAKSAKRQQKVVCNAVYEKP